MMGNPAWVPGVSGNPGGRPNGLQRVKRLARKHTEAAINKLAHLMEHGESQMVQLTAANYLLDRAWGRPAADGEERAHLTITIRKIMSENETEIVSAPPLIEHDENEQ